MSFGLVGAGGFGREVMPYARYSASLQLGVEEHLIDLFFVETGAPASDLVNDHPVVSVDAFNSLAGKKYFNIAIGDSTVRESVRGLLNADAIPLTIRSPNSLDLSHNHIGEGAILCPNVIITANAHIGKFFHANIFSYVAHDCVIGDYVTFAPGVRCNGRVHVGDHAYLGTNAVIRQGTHEKPIRIGAGAVVGMGAVVTKDVPDGITVIGNPARPMNRE